MNSGGIVSASRDLMVCMRINISLYIFHFCTVYVPYDKY